LRALAGSIEPLKSNEFSAPRHESA
jgi:hypothetical protein